jgi:hypothetical protein
MARHKGGFLCCPIDAICGTDGSRRQYQGFEQHSPTTLRAIPWIHRVQSPQQVGPDIGPGSRYHPIRVLCFVELWLPLQPSKEGRRYIASPLERTSSCLNRAGSLVVLTSRTLTRPECFVATSASTGARRAGRAPHVDNDRTVTVQNRALKLGGSLDMIRANRFATEELGQNGHGTLACFHESAQSVSSHYCGIRMDVRRPTAHDANFGEMGQTRRFAPNEASNQCRYVR